MAKSKTSTRHKAYKKKKAIQKLQIKQKVKQYKEQTNYVVPKEVIKERNKRAYEKRKQKLEKEKLESQNI